MHGIMPAKRGTRIKPVPTMANATKTKGGPRKSRSNGFAPYSVPSSNTSTPSVPSTSASSTSPRPETPSLLPTPISSMLNNSATNTTEPFTNLSIPPFDDFYRGLEPWQQQQSCMPTVPFFSPAHPITQPSIMPQSFWPNISTTSTSSHPQLGTVHDGLAYQPNVSHRNELAVTQIATEKEKLQLSQEELAALSMYYYSLPLFQAPRPPPYVPNYL